MLTRTFLLTSPAFILTLGTFATFQYYYETLLHFANLSTEPSSRVLFNYDINSMCLSWKILSFFSYCFPGIIFFITCLYLLFFAKHSSDEADNIGVIEELKMGIVNREKLLQEYSSNWFYRYFFRIIAWVIFRIIAFFALRLITVLISISRFIVILRNNLIICCYLILFLNIGYVYFLESNSFIDTKNLHGYIIFSLLPTIVSICIVIPDYKKRLKYILIKGNLP
jgi:hypothetical protein